MKYLKGLAPVGCLLSEDVLYWVVLGGGGAATAGQAHGGWIELLGGGGLTPAALIAPVAEVLGPTPS